MILLLASLAALFAGPACILLFGRRPGAVLAIDSFVLVAIGGLVFFHILPHSVSDGGWPAMVAAVAGLLAPVALHGPLDECSGRGNRSLLSLAVLGIASHAFFDGVALVGGASLALAVVLHRVLEGLGIWWLVRPHHGVRGTVMVVGTIAAATTAGYACGDMAVHSELGTWVSVVQAMVAGSLLHVLLRHAPPPSDLPKPQLQVASSLGGLAALALLWALEMAPEGAHAHVHAHSHAAGEGQAGFAFLELALWAAPALLLGHVCVALLHAVFSASARSLNVPPPTWRQALRGALVGLLVTECSCGVVPIYRQVVRDRAPPVAALAFLLAAPALGLSAFLLSTQFLGGPLTLWRTAGAAGIALAVGITVGRRLQAPNSEPVSHAHGVIPWRARSVDGVQFSFGEVLDSAAPWALFGLAVATFLLTAVQPSWIAPLRAAHLEVAVFTLLAAPFYLSAPAATLVAAVLWAKGASAGAVLAFLLASSAICMGTISFLARAYGGRIAAGIGLAIVAGAFGCGTLIDSLVPTYASSAPWEDACSPWRAVCGAVVLVLYVASLVRQGVRPFLGQVAVPNVLRAHSHHHVH